MRIINNEVKLSKELEKKIKKGSISLTTFLLKNDWMFTLKVELDYTEIIVYNYFRVVYENDFIIIEKNEI